MVRLDIVLDRYSEDPFGKQIADDIRERIVTKKLTAGTKLEAVRELGLRLGVSHQIVRHAYDTLRKQGYLETHKGVGTIVARTLHPPTAAMTIDHGTFDPEIPAPFRKHPLNRWMSADEVLQAIAILHDSWPNCSWAYQDLKYILQHFEGEFHGDVKELSDPRP